MRRAFITAVLLAPTLALAQVRIVEVGDKPDGIININECQGLAGFDSKFTFDWSLTSAVTLKISDRDGCPEPSNDTVAHTDTLGTFAAGTTSSGSYGASDLLSRLGVVSESCGAGANITVNVCVLPQNVSGGTGTTVTGTFLFDRTRPPTPTLPTVTPGDGALRVSWTQVSGSSLKYRVEARPSGSPEGTAPIRSDEITGDSHRLGGLTVGTQYDVVVIAISQGGNESAPSPIATGTPVQVDDFWRLYQGAGGGEEGGCSTTGGASLALLALAPFALRRRRS